MEIIYGGKTAFTLRGDRTVSIDGGEADIALFTKRQKNAALKINGPGEYEVSGVLITTLARAGALLHAVTLDDLNIAHVSGNPGALSERDLAAIGRIDILLLEAHEVRAAQAVIADLSPRVVIPFGPAAQGVAAATGVKSAEPQSRFSWNGSGTPPRAVLLKEPTAKRKAA
jgi:hypothetical protein